MNRKLYFIGFALILLVSLVSAAKVGYIYRSESRIDSNIVNVFKEMGLETDFINENNLQNLSKYNFIYVGDEAFTKIIPISEYNSIVANYYLGQKSGVTDSDGVSKLASKHNLNVNINGKLLEVYNQFVDNKGMSIPYYFLDDNNKVSEFKRYAGTDTTSVGNPFGDVISFGEKGLTLENGKISKGNICFFGIVKSQYWTEEARDLLKECANFVNIQDVPVEPIITCNSDSQCNDNNPNSLDKCNNPGTSASSCSHETITCNNDVQCNDNNPKTTDKCLNSGTTSSSCHYGIINCNINSDCGTNVFIGNTFCQSSNVFQNFISFSCNNPGTEESTCTNSTSIQLKLSCNSCLNGQCVEIIEITCNSDSQCNDNNPNSLDKCNNPGTSASSCSHETITCNNDAQCNDNKPKTIDKCLNSGTTSSSCSHDLIICNTNLDCDDGNSSTEDVCFNSGLVNSVCIHNLPGKVKLISLIAVPYETSVQLSFSAIPGNGSGVKGYFLSMDRNQWLWTLENNYVFSGLNSSSAYNFYVKAEDNLNQTSDEVNVSVTTLSIFIPASGGSGSSSASVSASGQGNGLCITQWDCSSWSECKDSQQTRTCSYPDYYCNATAPKPIVKQSCVEVEANLTADSGIVQEDNGDNSDANTGRLASITGGVIGAVGDHPLWFVLGFLGVIGLIYGFLRIRK